MNLKELKEILQMLDERDITEFELEEEGRRLRVRRPGAPHPVGAGASAPLVISTAPIAMPAVSAAPPAAEPASAGQATVAPRRPGPRRGRAPWTRP